jgi:hypothetical protein
VEATITVTILDMPEMLALLEEALSAVPEWERAPLRERLDEIVERAHQRRGR